METIQISSGPFYFAAKFSFGGYVRTGLAGFENPCEAKHVKYLAKQDLVGPVNVIRKGKPLMDEKSPPGKPAGDFLFWRVVSQKHPEVISLDDKNGRGITLIERQRLRARIFREDSNLFYVRDR